MKTIVTHKRPHLDDLCAAWLLRAYEPGAEDAALDFIATTPTGGETKNDPDILYVGIGRGKFDEHKGDRGQSAATLVHEHLLAEGLVPEGDRRALEKLVEWVRLEDTGRLTTMPYREFSVQVLLQSLYAETHESAHVAAFCFVALDAAFSSAKNMVALERDWQNRVPFTSRFGPAVGYVTAAHEADSFAYGQGYDLVAFMNPTRTHHNIRARAETSIDLTPVYDALKAREPDAWWYLHHSKKLLICGGDIAPGATASKLALEDIIELLKPPTS